VEIKKKCKKVGIKKKGKKCLKRNKKKRTEMIQNGNLKYSI